MIRCKILNEDFNTYEEMFSAIRKHYSKIKSIKKSILKSSDGFEAYEGLDRRETKKDTGEQAQIDVGSKVYPVINTTRYMDSHDDVHLNGIWNKTIQESVGKIALVMNHEYKMGQVIAYPEDVVPMVKVVPWKDLGRDYEGDTEALIFEALLSDDSNDTGFKAYRNRRKVQHSVRMQYVKIDFAVNSDKEEWKEERKVWEKYINSIANKDKALKNGYFWAVKEAKIYKEGSMVLEGSNDATPTLYEADSYITSTVEPEKSTQKRLALLNEILTLSKS